MSSSAIQRQRLKWGSTVLLVGTATAFGLAFPETGRAQEFDERPDPTWFVRTGGRLLFNVKGNVSRVGRTSEPGRYDNGYVFPDIGGTASGKTWNWGYSESDQFSGGQVQFQQLSGLPEVGEMDGETDNPGYGGEFFFGNELVRFEVGAREGRVGFEVGYAYNSYSASQRSVASSTATYTTASYGAAGIIPPTPPYRGTEKGPGPLIDLNPSSTSTVDSPSQGIHEGDLDANLHTLKVGFWTEYPLTTRLAGAFSLGYASILTDAKYQYTEAYSFSDPSIPEVDPQSGTIDGWDWKPGIYTQLRLQYQFNRHWHAYAGGEFEWCKDFQTTDQGFRINLDYGALFSASAGLMVRF